MITWQRIEAIDEQINYLDSEILKRKKEQENNIFDPHKIIDLLIDLDNVRKNIDPLFLIGKPLTQQEVVNYWYGGGGGSLIFNDISERRRMIELQFENLKDSAFRNRTIELNSSLDAVAEIHKELHEIEDKRDQLNRRGESLSKLDSDLMNFLNTQLKRREGLPIKKQIKEKPAPITTLLEAFDSPSKYQKIMQLMVDKGFIQSLTYIWKDEKNSNLGTIVSVLKVLHFQKYYTDNRRLKPEEIKQIIKNTFGRDISSGYIKHHKLPEKDKTFNFIPIASTLI